jgi:hypothetical protein
MVIHQPGAVGNPYSSTPVAGTAAGSSEASFACGADEQKTGEILRSAEEQQ